MQVWCCLFPSSRSFFALSPHFKLINHLQLEERQLVYQWLKNLTPNFVPVAVNYLDYNQSESFFLLSNTFILRTLATVLHSQPIPAWEKLVWLMKRRVSCNQKWKLQSPGSHWTPSRNIIWHNGTKHLILLRSKLLKRTQSPSRMCRCIHRSPWWGGSVTVGILLLRNSNWSAQHGCFSDFREMRASVYRLISMPLWRRIS